MSKFPEWNSLLVERDASRQADLCRALASSVATAEIEQLLQLLDPKEEAAPVALKVLMAVARTRPQLLKGDRQQEIENRLGPLLEAYPQASGLSAFYLLHLINPPQAEEFLVRVVKSAVLKDRDLLTVAANLALFPASTAASDALNEIVKRGGKAGEDARRRLENLGNVNAETIDALGRNWRETRAREPLNRLFEVFISRQGGRPIASVLEVLGPPSEHTDLRYFYHTADGLTLYLEQDLQGNLTAMRIK